MILFKTLNFFTLVYTLISAHFLPLFFKIQNLKKPLNFKFIILNLKFILFFKIKNFKKPLKFIITNLRFILFFIIVKCLALIIADFDLLLLEENDGETIKKRIIYSDFSDLATKYEGEDEFFFETREDKESELRRLENQIFYGKIVMVISAIGLISIIGLAFYYNTEGYREYLNQITREETFRIDAARKAANFEIALKNSEVILGKDIKAEYWDSWRSFANSEIIAQISDCHKNIVWSNVERHILTWAHACENIFVVDGILPPGITYEEVLFHKMTCAEFNAARLNPLEYDSGLKERDIWGWFMKEKEYLFPIHKPCTCPPPQYFLP